MDRETHRIQEIDNGRRAERILESIEPYTTALEERLVEEWKTSNADDVAGQQRIRYRLEALQQILSDIENDRQTGRMAEKEQIQ